MLESSLYLGRFYCPRVQLSHPSRAFPISAVGSLFVLFHQLWSSLVYLYSVVSFFISIFLCVINFLLPLGSFNLSLGPGRRASCPTLTPTSPPACCRVCFASNVRLDVIAHFLARIASSLKLSAFPLAFSRVVGSVGSRNVSCWTECANTRLSSSGMISNSTRSMVNRQRRVPNGKRDGVLNQSTGSRLPALHHLDQIRQKGHMRPSISSFLKFHRRLLTSDRDFWNAMNQTVCLN